MSTSRPQALTLVGIVPLLDLLILMVCVMLVQARGDRPTEATAIDVPVIDRHQPDHSAPPPVPTFVVTLRADGALTADGRPVGSPSDLTPLAAAVRAAHPGARAELVADRKAPFEAVLPVQTSLGAGGFGTVDVRYAPSN